MKNITHLVTLLFASSTFLHAEEGKQASVEQLVAKTHAASLNLRKESLRRTIAKDTCWPPGLWGENLWCLAGLYLNEKTDLANERLLRRAKAYIATKPANATPTSPENPGNLPWTFFSVTDYVRTLCLFHAKSPHFPGRLKPETEAAMKEALWLWVSGESQLADAGTNDLFLLLGTENHDLNRRPAYYLVTALLQDDPSYRDRKLADGHTTAEHAAASTVFYREWPRRRAQSGLWVEGGSNTYQKYSWPGLFNLHELAPDPVIRHRFGLLLDLAFVEEEQIAVKGRRGGGRSRAEYAPNAFESYKNLLYAPEGPPSGSSHSRVIETSRYQLPAEAILLRYRTFPAAQPFVIRNRVLGELASGKSEDKRGQRLAADSALVNYAYRTPHYLLGTTLQSPALTMLDPTTGAPTLKYSGISRQKRACGMLFDDPASNEICAVHPEIGHGSGGRPQHSFWSVQHENVLILQRIASLGRSTLGSYSTDAVGISFEGKALKKVEEAGWIFASNGKAFVGVKFLDGGYQWDKKQALATPANFHKATDKSRILLHAGDIESHGSFERFKADVLASRLNVAPDKVAYQFGPSANHLEVTLYDAKSPDRFTLPLINGKPVDLRPTKTYQSPYLNGDFGSDKVSVTVGPIKRVLNFSEEGQQSETTSEKNHTMKHIVPLTVTFLLASAATINAAEPLKPLYTCEGTDPSFADVLKSSGVKPGERFSQGPVLGSRIHVSRERLEKQVGKTGPIPEDIGLHTEACGAINRKDFGKWTRWYQEDGNTQVFRLFKGEQNIRGGTGKDGSPGRVEAFSRNLTVSAGTWHEWEGTYTVIQPVGACIFQLMHEGSLWPFHIEMSDKGDISFLRRRSVPGAERRIPMAESMVGNSLSIRVRANGEDYEVYQKAPLDDLPWKLVTKGSFTKAKDNKVSFRWGMYCGSKKGQTVPNDAMIFVTGATMR